jgi:hypothetical protein
VSPEFDDRRVDSIDRTSEQGTTGDLRFVDDPATVILGRGGSEEMGGPKWT